MPNVTIAIASDGTMNPSNFHINPGETASFEANGNDVVLCVDPEGLFGEERYEIPNGTTLDLVVQATANNISFELKTRVGDLEASCTKRGTGGDGGGDTGPP